MSSELSSPFLRLGCSSGEPSLGQELFGEGRSAALNIFRMSFDLSRNQIKAQAKVLVAASWGQVRGALHLRDQVSSGLCVSVGGSWRCVGRKRRRMMMVAKSLQWNTGGHAHCDAFIGPGDSQPSPPVRPSTAVAECW